MGKFFDARRVRCYNKQKTGVVSPLKEVHMSRLWVRTIRHHRIDRQHTVPCVWGEEQQALEVAMNEMDLPVPMWLNKHDKEYSDFRHTAFLPDHFIETVDFERLEIEYLSDDGKRRKSKDYRNQF